MFPAHCVRTFYGSISLNISENDYCQVSLLVGVGSVYFRLS